jgi:hypothetical protein
MPKELWSARVKHIGIKPRPQQQREIPAPGIQTGRQTLHGAMYVSGFIRLRRTRSLKAEPPPAYTGFAENVLRTIRWSSCLL